MRGELLTSDKWFGIDPSKLYVTIFEGDAQVARDDEAEQLWLGVGVPKERIFELGAKDNFWQMGGDWALRALQRDLLRPGRAGERERRGQAVWGGRTSGTWRFGTWCSCSSTGASSGELTPLPKPSIDTGMGLERIACVLQGKLSNYQSDLFTPLIAKAAELTGFAMLSADEAGHFRHEKRSVPPDHRRPLSRRHLPDCRRRQPRQRRPRLRPAQKYSAAASAMAASSARTNRLCTRWSMRSATRCRPPTPN